LQCNFYVLAETKTVARHKTAAFTIHTLITVDFTDMVVTQTQQSSTAEMDT